MNILVAVDQSVESQDALVSALEMADVLDGSVTAAHAIATEDAESTDRGEAILEDAVERAENHDVPLETELLVGDPTRVIPEYAEDNDVQAIYVGHRGISSGPEGPSDRGPLGSVAEGIVRHTDVPVTVFDRRL